jgi:hypothetical protein
VKYVKNPLKYIPKYKKAIIQTIDIKEKAILEPVVGIVQFFGQNKDKNLLD